MFLVLNEKSLFSKEFKLACIKENVALIADEIARLTIQETVIKLNSLLGIEKKLLSIITDEGGWVDFKE